MNIHTPYRIVCTFAKSCFQYRFVRIMSYVFVIWLCAYLLLYAFLIGRGERRAKASGERKYFLVATNATEMRAECAACWICWPLYSVDFAYANDNLEPWCMPRKEMGLIEYVSIWRINYRYILFGE